VPGRTAVTLTKLLAHVVPSFCRKQLHNPVFFVGCGRSGTTILSQTLAQHPDIAVYPGEANERWHPHLYPWAKAMIDAPPFWIDPVAFTQASLNQPERDKHDTYLQAVFGAYQLLHGGRVFLNKSVMVTFMILHLLQLFPEAKFIHLVRDGRAVALSYAQKEQEKIQEAETVYRAKGYSLDFDQLLEAFAQHWQAHIAEIERQKKSLSLVENGRLLEISYENLCADTRQTLADLCAFLDVDISTLPPELTSFRNMNYKVNESLSPAQNALLSQSTQPILQHKGYT